MSRNTDDDVRQEEQESNNIIHNAEIHNWMKEKGRELTKKNSKEPHPNLQSLLCGDEITNGSTAQL
jgi:hypothetical protein